MIPASLEPISRLLNAHRTYRTETLNLIASENVMSPAVEALFTAELSHRYGDYTGIAVSARKYTGNRYLAELDAGTQAAVQSLFGCQFADLRPLSGHVAGIAVLMALCKPGDTVLELNSAGGGHRLAEKLTQAGLCPLRVLPLELDPATYTIDIDRAVETIHRERPRVVILGSSLFLFPHPIRPIAEAVHAIGGILQFDASHVLGLIAGGTYPNPLNEGADVITSSTHKTFAGPQGGLILTNDAVLYEKIAPTIYPALVTNHHLHRLPALWAVCEEWREFGQEQAKTVVENARLLGAALTQVGFDMVGKEHNYTDTHTLLVREPNAKSVALQLEAANILVTPVGLPASLGGACLRIGVQEITRRGMVPKDAAQIAALLARGRAAPIEQAQEIVPEVANLVRSWNTYRFTWPTNAAQSGETRECVS